MIRSRLDTGRIRAAALTLLASVAAVLRSSPALAAIDGWDSVLERDNVGEPGDWCAYPPAGWLGSDGGFTALHTSSAGTRAIWFFGDTEVGEDAAGATHNMQPNTMLVSNVRLNGLLPTTLNFYTRRGADQGPDYTGTPLDITTDASDFTRPWYDPKWKTTKTVWWWPEKSIVPPNSNTLYSFWARIRCKDITHAYMHCNDGVMNPDPVPFELRGFPRICKTDNVTGAATGWPNPSCENISDAAGNAPLDRGFVWGRALTRVGDYTYIYGYTIVNGFPENVVLARAMDANIQNYSAWEFLRIIFGAPTWNTSLGPPTAPSDMWIVATGASTFFTVDKININNVPRWLMVQGWGAYHLHLVVRVGNTDFEEGTTFYDIPYTSDSHTVVKPVGGTGGIDPRCGAWPTNDVYHQTAQWGMSDKFNKKLMISYYCAYVNHKGQTNAVTPWDVNGDHACDQGSDPALTRGCTDSHNIATCGTTGTIGRIRFYNQDLMKIRPWCTSDCDTP